MSDVELAILSVLGGAIATAAASSAFHRRDDQARRTGERIGGLEKRADWWEGFFEGVKYGRDHKDKGNGK